MMVTVPMRAALGFAVTLVASSLAIEARAQDASPWLRDGHSAVRLLAGSRSGAVLLGGVAFQLQPGWKTYWRSPGDSGVPPRFDFSKSQNVEAVTVLWPAPTKFDEGAGAPDPSLPPAPAATRWATTTRSCCHCALSQRMPTSRSRCAPPSTTRSARN